MFGHHLRRHRFNHAEQFRQQRVIVYLQQRGDMLLGDDDDVQRVSRAGVIKGQRALGFGDFVYRGAPAQDFIAVEIAHRAGSPCSAHHAVDHATAF